MQLNEYQDRAMLTCTPSSANFSYMALNLIGEMGEFCSKIAKGIRKEQIDIYSNRLMVVDPSEEAIKTAEDIDHQLKLEAGDILWQFAGLCKTMGWNLEDVAQMNIDKLSSRQERNVIVGDGDNR